MNLLLKCIFYQRNLDIGRVEKESATEAGQMENI